MIKQKKTNIPAYTEYAQSLENLSADEKDLVKELIEIAKLIGPIFKKTRKLELCRCKFLSS